jgi:hypothetical protein
MSHIAPTDSAAQSESEQSPAIDIDLPCPLCDYNLRGLIEERCPECGEAFDRAALRDWALARDAPVGADWRGNRLSLWQIWLACLFEPARVGQSLPPFPATRNLARYTLITRGVSVLAVITMTLFATLTQGAWPPLLLILPLFCAIPVVVSRLCEAGIAVLLSFFVEPRSVPPWHRYPFCRALCACFSSHFPLSCAIAVTALVLDSVCDISHRIFAETGRLAIISVAAVSLWWWWGLARAITTRTNPSAVRTAVILLIPVVGAACVSLACAIALAVAALIALGR